MKIINCSNHNDIGNDSVDSDDDMEIGSALQPKHSEDGKAQELNQDII